MPACRRVVRSTMESIGVARLTRSDVLACGVVVIVLLLCTVSAPPLATPRALSVKISSSATPARISRPRISVGAASLTTPDPAPCALRTGGCAAGVVVICAAAGAAASIDARATRQTTRRDWANAAPRSNHIPCDPRPRSLFVRLVVAVAVAAELVASAAGLRLVEDDANIRTAADIGQRLLDGALAGL